jgi:TrpR-related protein YerC/YecD
MKLHRSSNEQGSYDPRDSLYQAMAKINTQAEAKQFLLDLCTPAELQAMADRWWVVDLLKAGKSYRQICDETSVSVTTIGRVARCLAMGEGGYNLIYERLETLNYENQNQVKNSHSKEWTFK